MNIVKSEEVEEEEKEVEFGKITSITSPTVADVRLRSRIHFDQHQHTLNTKMSKDT